jgi:hypothetical protein
MLMSHDRADPLSILLNRQARMNLFAVQVLYHHCKTLRPSYKLCNGVHGDP